MSAVEIDKVNIRCDDSWSALRDRPFRRLWGAECVSYLGDWFTTLALLMIAVELTGSAWAFAALLLAKTVPTALAVPVAARLNGWGDRRVVMALTLGGRGVCVGGVGLGYALGAFPIVLGFVALSAVLSGVFQPARTAAIGALVPSKHLSRAISLSGASWSVMLAVGAAVGGLVTHWVGLPMALAIDGLTFAAAMVLTLTLPALPATARRATPLWTALKQHRSALPTVLLKATMGLASGALSLLPLLVVEVGGDATALGLGGFYAARGVGALIGARVMARHRTGVALRQAVNLGFGAVVVGLLLMVLTGEPWGAALGFGITGFGCTVIWVGSGVEIQAQVQGPARAALFAVETGAMAAAVALVSLPSSLLVDGGWMTPRAVVGVGAAVVGIAALVGALSRPGALGNRRRLALAGIGSARAVTTVDNRNPLTLPSTVPMQCVSGATVGRTFRQPELPVAERDVDRLTSLKRGSHA